MIHQEFQVPKNGGADPYKASVGVGFPLHKPTAHAGEYLHFRYLKCLVIDGFDVQCFQLGTLNMYQKHHVFDHKKQIPCVWSFVECLANMLFSQ